MVFAEWVFLVLFIFYEKMRSFLSYFLQQVMYYYICNEAYRRMSYFSFFLLGIDERVVAFRDERGSKTNISMIQCNLRSKSEFTRVDLLFGIKHDCWQNEIQGMVRFWNRCVRDP